MRLPAAVDCAPGAALAALLGLLCCAGQDERTARRPDALRGACPTESRVGGFELVYGSSRSFVSGAVTDGVVPSAVPVQVASAGSCRLVRKNNPSCDPACPSGDVCGDDGTCVPYPLNQDVGTVTLDGLLRPVAMPPTSESFLYFDTSLPHPPFAPGTPLTLSADGATTSAFTLYGDGIDALETESPSWTLTRGEPLAITWTPDAVPTAVVQATLSVDQHGTTPAGIVCEGPDSGTLELPAALIDALLDLGVSGFPAAFLDRGTQDSVDTELGCVDFAVTSSISIELTLTQ